MITVNAAIMKSADVPDARIAKDARSEVTTVVPRTTMSHLSIFDRYTVAMYLPMRPNVKNSTKFTKSADFIVSQFRQLIAPCGLVSKKHPTWLDYGQVGCIAK
ncbi:MAG TPA: hypothetical protein PK667_13230 [Nitrosomonas europaea]|uniref:hypothetical protein n=1 Tax=Nitrosomonas europaea TaxID=915 RepID=UPI002BFCCB67|nr:hypothetical protein [Nitrosomonas europaea]HRN82697.1 hypothetical protein [Nitrosomonas europaea]HUM75131.1 hypothetical protein [Nitrosomonas europaea]